jgi:DinB superfamily
MEGGTIMNTRLVATVIERLDAGARTIDAFTRTAPPDLVKFRPAPEKWTMLEILGHLYDEERLDFRARIDLTLNSPEAEWPRIDPERWVKEQDFNSRALADLLTQFLDERRHSLEWLYAHRDEDWSRTHHHPRLGSFTASSLLCAWAAHDVLHIRQLAGIVYRHLSGATTPDRVEYAGRW